MKKILKYGVIFLIITILVGLPMYITISNDMIAKRTEKELKHTSLPENTEIIDSISIAGKLTGNGNGMQYFGAILIKTDLSEEDLNNYYNQYRENEWSFVVKKQDTNKIEVIEHGSYNLKKYNENDKEKYYIIYSWGSSKNDFLVESDLRGH